MKKYAVPILMLILMAGMPLSGCRKKEQPAETTTGGNATDRTPNGTSGTGEPASPATGSAAAATSLATAPPTIVGKEEVHGASKVTTSTIQGPNTTTQSVDTPTGSTSTVVATSDTSTTIATTSSPKKKKP